MGATRKTKIPQLERLVCISTDAQVQLAAIVSSYFQKPGHYIPVFRFPSVDFPHSPSSDFGKDGYIARVMGDRAAQQINNALARLQPASVLLLGMTETEKSYLRAVLPPTILVEVENVEDISNHLPFAPLASESIECSPAQMIEGLLQAKFTGKILKVREGAPVLPSVSLRGSDGILVIDNATKVNDIAAVNYAFAIDADVALVPAVDRHEIRDLARQLHAWSNDNSHFEYQQLKAKVSKRLKEVDISRYKFATFFTTGVPYGLFLKNSIPCSHVMKDVNCGVFISNTLMEEHSSAMFDSAVVFSPELFPSEETSRIVNLLGDSNYTVKSLLGKDATVGQLSNYGTYFPYDLMHICAHGGETEGYFVVQKFADREGAEHTLEYYEVVGFAPSGGDMVRVHRKLIFKRLDGFPWMSRPLKDFPRYVFEDMTKAMKENDDEVIRTRFDSKIALSCHIQCSDSIHQGDFGSLAGYGNPVVFNNTCASSHELAAMFIDAGARSYIGTLWAVGNETATNAALVFYKEALQERNILTAFDAMNASLKSKKYQNVYILWGLHLSSLRKPQRKSDTEMFGALVTSYFMWLKKITSTEDPEVKRNGIPVARFLLEAIVSNFSQERVEQLANFDPTAIEEEERIASSLPPDDFSRGITEMDIFQQRQRH